MDVLSEYVNAQIRCATAQCLDQLGFTQASSSCFDAMSDVMMLYLKKFCSTVKFCAEQRGQTTPCLVDVNRAFHFMRVSHHELYDYLKQVRSIEPPLLVPSFPVSHLEKWSPADNQCQTVTAVVDEDLSVKEDEEESTKFIPDFSGATAYSAGFVSKSSLTRSSSDKMEQPSIKILLPLPPSRVSPLPSMDHKSCRMVSANELETEKRIPSASENSKSERESSDFDPASAKRKKAVQDHCGAATTHGSQRTLINLPKKKIRGGTTNDATKNEAREFVPKKESPRLIELREKLEKQRQMFKEVLEKAQALLREEEEILEKPSTSVEKDESSERKVPPLKLKIIRGPEGVGYQIVKPQFILHFKQSVLLDSGLAEVTSTECQESSGQHFGESETPSKPPERNVRKHEGSRNKKAGTMPYLASDLMKNSYTVLTACMSGRAFPDLSCKEDGCKDQKTQELNAEDSFRTQKVHEVIWHRLFSQDGIIGRQTRKMPMDELAVVVHNRADHSKRSLVLPFKMDDTVKMIEERLSQKLGVPAQQLRVVLCGHALEECTMMKDLLLGPTTSLIVFVENQQPSASVVGAASSDSPSDSLIARGTPEIGSFYVWCKTCKDIRRGKLRVYCSECSSSAVLVKTEPSCWRDVTRSKQIHVDCEECKSVEYAVFRFKCVKCNEIGAVLSHIRGNWEHAECSVCLDEHNTYLFDLGCHHMVCRQCFVECLNLALEETKFVFRPPYGYTITCPYPGCERCITDVHHFHVLGDEKYERYQKTAAEKLVAMDDQGVFCPYPDCSASFFWEVENGDGKTSCPECLRLFCRLCKSPKCICGTDDPSTVTIKATTKKCPGCGAHTERNQGCSHIHCIACKMDWCFICEAPWTDDCQWNHWFS